MFIQRSEKIIHHGLQCFCGVTFFLVIFMQRTSNFCLHIIVIGKTDSHITHQPVFIHKNNSNLKTYIGNIHCPRHITYVVTDFFNRIRKPSLELIFSKIRTVRKNVFCIFRFGKPDEQPFGFNETFHLVVCKFIS